MLIDIDLSTGKKNIFYVYNISSTARLQIQRSYIKQEKNEQPHYSIHINTHSFKSSRNHLYMYMSERCIFMCVF